MEYRRPKEGEKYRHFKGNVYRVLAIAKHSETLEELVVYEDTQGEHAVYARPIEMFISKVEKDKYPDVMQEYRFELIKKEDKRALLMDFLDLKTVEEKIYFLQHKREDLTEEFLELAAQCLDFTESKNGFEDRYYDLMRYLRTIEKYEGRRGGQ